MATEFVCSIRGAVCTVGFDRFEIDFSEFGRYLGKRRVDGGRGKVSIPEHLFSAAQTAAIEAFNRERTSFRSMGRKSWKSHMDYTATPDN